MVTLPEKAFNLFLWRILINTGNEYDKVNVGDSFRKLNFKWKEMEGLEKKKKREKEIVISIVREGWRWGEMDDSALSTRIGLLELSLRQ